MIVDDEVDLADAMAEALAGRGFVTQAIYDPALALETFREEPDAWDAVLTDQVMPKVDGIALIRRLKRIRPDIPVMLYSGFSEGDIEKKARQVGAAAFFRKPVGPDVIARFIATLPSGRESAA